LEKLADLLWYPSLTFFLVGVGITLSVKFQWIQIRRLPSAFRGMTSPPKGIGEFSPFSAMSTALAGMIGTGNITGVAAAVSIGGPGAVFWMAIAAFFGMATKFAETFLACSTRRTDKTGHCYGGPMIYIETLLGSRRLGVAYAMFAVLSSLIGSNLIQANSIAFSVRDAFQIPPVLTAIILTLIVFFCIIGGAKRIGKFCSFAVPIAAVLYITICIVLIVFRINRFPSAIKIIFDSALGLRSFGGAGAGIAIRYGVSRGVFTNESGIGSEAIYTAASKANPFSQSLLAMLTPLIDTIIVCTLTGLALVLTNSLTADDAFSSVFGTFGSGFIALSLTIFGLATVIGASYFGDRCITYLRHGQPPKHYKYLWCAVIWIGCLVPTQGLWCLSDIFTALMAVPNLFALIYGIKQIKSFT